LLQVCADRLLLAETKNPWPASATGQAETSAGLYRTRHVRIEQAQPRRALWFSHG